MTITEQDMRGALARLAECFPQTFVREKHLPHRPLKVGIAADILARCPELDRLVLNTALGHFTRRAIYLQGMVTGVARIDLDGNPCGGVSAEAAEHAAAKLASREVGQSLVAASRAARSMKQRRRQAYCPRRQRSRRGEGRCFALPHSGDAGAYHVLRNARGCRIGLIREPSRSCRKRRLAHP
jgi:sRNA-binding protein